jgi:DNA-directed RNA polymerase subunit RPC12/RpoP
VSTCISKHGEFSSHEVDDEFTCRLCGSFDETGALERIRRLERGGEELGKSLLFWMELARKVTDSDDVIEEDGDGDWGVVAERLADMRRPWRPEDGDSRCQECGTEYLPWSVEDDLWNGVIGTEENPRGEGTVLCPTCFVRRAVAGESS